MTTIIKAADPAAFLSLLPRLAGCRITRSVVLVPFEGDRTLGVLRVDLPADTADVDALAATLVGMVCKVRVADGVAIVVYTDDPLAGSDGFAHHRLVRALEDKADACGLRLADALCVAADGWGSYAAADAVAHPLSDLDVVDERLPDDLREPLVELSAGAELPAHTDAERAAVASALVEVHRTMTVLTRATKTPRAAKKDLSEIDPQALAATVALDDVVELFEDALEVDAVTLRAHHAAAFAWALARPALRDIALVQWCGGRDLGERALLAQLRWEDGEPFPEEIAQYMWGDAPQPDAARLRRALTLVRHVAALSPDEVRAGALAAAGWLAWALGRSTHAGVYAEAAEALEPGHTLAGILRAMLAAGHLPEWAFNRARSTVAAT